MTPRARTEFFGSPLFILKSRGAASPPGSASVGGVPIDILSPNEKRVGLVITNEGALSVYLAFDHDAEVGKGLLLERSASLTLTGVALSTGRLSAIASAATQLVVWQEFNLE